MPARGYWVDLPSTSTPILAADLEDISAYNSDEVFNVKHPDYNAQGDDANDDTVEIQAALDACAAAGGGVVYVPPGTYLISGVLRINQFVNLVGAGKRETIFKLTAAGARLLFNEYLAGGSPVNSRGGRSGGFRVNGQTIATECMRVELAVNRKFDDFFLTSPAANGIALHTLGTQNCTFSEFGVEATRATTVTTGIKVDDATGGCRFENFDTNEFSKAAIWVTQTNAGAQYGINYPEPRHNIFDSGMIERGVPNHLILVDSGRDIRFYNMELAQGIGETVASGYNIVEVSEVGAGITRDIKFYGGVMQGNTDASKKSTGFKLLTATGQTTITGWTFGNNLVGIDGAVGHKVKAYNNTFTATDTRTTGEVNFLSLATNGGGLTPTSTMDFYKITGTANLTQLGATYIGHEITLLFTGTAATTGVVDGSNLKIAGDFAYTPDDTMELWCDGTNWYELSRSAN